MLHLTPHLLLRAESTPSQIAESLGVAGYIVSKIGDDELAEHLAGAAHIDGVVIELPAFLAIRFGRQLEARHGAATPPTLIIARAAETVRRALPWASVLTPAEAEDDLVSAIDLAIAAREMRPTG